MNNTKELKAYYTDIPSLDGNTTHIIFTDSGAGRARWLTVKALWEAHYDHMSFKDVEVRRAPLLDYVCSEKNANRLMTISAAVNSTQETEQPSQAHRSPFPAEENQQDPV